MRFLKLALTHARIAGRQRGLWVAPALLALLSLSASVNSGMPYETDDVSDLALFAQMLALLPPIAYAAACVDLAAAPARLGLGEVEDASPVSAVRLAAARVAGTFAVVSLPSLLLLAFCGFGQFAHGNPLGPLQAVALFATTVAPAALLAMAIAALAGALLPRALSRIAGVVGWVAVLAITAFAGEPVAGGGMKIHLAASPVLQAFFGAGPMLDTSSSAAPAAPLAALVFLAGELAVMAALLSAASIIARRCSYKRG